MRPGFRAGLGALGILLLIPFLFGASSVVGQTAVTTPVFLPLVMNNLAVGTVRNSDFEMGRTGWTEFSKLNYAIILSTAQPALEVRPHSGNWLAWLGGDDDEDSFVAQDVSVTAGQSSLSFWYLIDSVDRECGRDFGRVEVEVGGTTTVVAEYDLCVQKITNDWVQATLDLAAFAGQTVTLRFTGVTDPAVSSSETDYSSFYIDDVTFEEQQ